LDFAAKGGKRQGREVPLSLKTTRFQKPNHTEAGRAIFDAAAELAMDLTVYETKYPFLEFETFNSGPDILYLITKNIQYTAENIKSQNRSSEIR
jgi:hypothetical protein